MRLKSEDISLLTLLKSPVLFYITMSFILDVHKITWKSSPTAQMSQPTARISSGSLMSSL